MPSLVTRTFFSTTSDGRYRAIAAAIVVGAVTFQADRAAAVSAAVRHACMSDYFAYCSQHDVGSQALRKCMRSAGPKLSKPCVSALVAAGEVGETKVAQAKIERRSAKARRKPA